MPPPIISNISQYCNKSGTPFSQYRVFYLEQILADKTRDRRSSVRVKQLVSVIHCVTIKKLQKV